MVGDHFELIEIMFQIAKSPYIKLCLSSRPWNCFEDALGGEADRKLYIQDLTKHDIKICSRKKLMFPKKWANVEKAQEQHQELALETVERAQGGFFGVYLVVRSLQNRLVNSDSLSMLRTRLQSLPTDLNTYFFHILKSANDIYRSKLGTILQAVLVAQEPLSLLTCSFINEDDPDFSIKLAASSHTVAEIYHREKNTRRQINGMSKGLLEVSKTKVAEIDGFRVEFLHRTVHDFLNEKEVSSILDSMTPEGYNACSVIGRALLAAFKFTPLAPDVLLQALDFASKADEQSSSADITMLDELNKANKIKSGSWDAEREFLEDATSKGACWVCEICLSSIASLSIFHRWCTLGYCSRYRRIHCTYFTEWS